MALILNKLFVILRLVSNRALVVWPCVFLIVLNAQDAPTKDLDRKIDTEWGTLVKVEKIM